jgi:hypothetical protein
VNDGILRTAEISPCGRFRTRLGRRWAAGPALVLLMLNPSDGDDMIDDPTIKRGVSFAQRDQYPALEIVNLFPFRSPYPAKLREYIPTETAYEAGIALQAIESACWTAARVCCAWGAFVGAEHRIQAVRRTLRAIRVEPYCLGTNKDGSPKHPLYLRGDTIMEKYQWT